VENADQSGMLRLLPLQTLCNPSPMIMASGQM
jgi:hypothetical protein